MVKKDKLTIYKKLNDEFYYRLTTFIGFHEVGYKNRYGHEVVYALDINHLISRPKIRKRLIRRIIRLLENINQKLWKEM